MPSTHSKVSIVLEQFRWVLISFAMGGIVLTLVRIWSPAPAAQSKRTVSLPATVPLSHWQFIQSMTLQPPQEATLQEGSYYSALGARKYRYRQSYQPSHQPSHQLLDIELWFMDNSNGDVPRFTSLYSSPPVRLGQVQKGELHYVPRAGHYLRFVAGDRTYWSSCISAKGENTVTISQFTQKGFTQNLKPDRLLAWLLESRSLFDRQCLWSNFSVPSIDLKSQNDAERKIIKTWTEWTQWWQNSRILDP